MPIEKPFTFISYKTEEREVAQRVRQALALGTKSSIWWDQDLQAGGQWSEELDNAIAEAACIVVLWSSSSVESDWVQQECAVGKAAGKLVPARIEECDIPLPYQQIQTANLTDWNGSEQHPEFRKLIAATLKLVEQQKQQDLAIAEEEVEISQARSLRKWITGFLPHALLTMATFTLVYLLFATNSQVENLQCLTAEFRQISASKVKRDVFMMEKESLLGEQRLLFQESNENPSRQRIDYMDKRIKHIDEMLGIERENLDISNSKIGRDRLCEN